MVLVHPIWLLSLILLPLPWLLLRRKGHVGISNLKIHKNLKGSSFISWLPMTLLILGFVALAIALARPQSKENISTETFKSRDIIISLDKSGSMESSLGPVPPPVVGETELDKNFPGKPEKILVKPDPYGYSSYNAKPGTRQIDHAIAAVLDFVRYRYKADAGDRIGIFTFDDDQYWSWPLTHDLKMIFRKAYFADEGIGGGTNFGRNDPGPLDAAVEHLQEMGKSQSKVFIMVTDGQDRIDARTFDRLQNLAADNDVRLYVIGVGRSIAAGNADILQLARATGGESFIADKPGDLTKSFQAIDEMERSIVTVEVNERRKDLYQWFAIPALLLLTLGTLLRALVVRR